MNNKNHYVLTIELNGDGTGQDSPIASGSEQTSSGSLTKPEAVVFTSYLMAKPFIDKTEQMIMNNVHTKYANQEYEMRVQLAMNAVNKGLGLMAGIAGGKSLASLLGLSGTAGAAIGGVLAVAGMAMDIAVKQNAINNSRIVENEGLSILRGRAGIQFNKSRSGQ